MWSGDEFMVPVWVVMVLVGVVVMLRYRERVMGFVWPVWRFVKRWRRRARARARARRKALERGL